MYSFDKPLARNNRDVYGVDAQGQRLLNLCKNSQIRLMNGRTIGDRMGNFTRFPLSIRESPSTLDYMATDTSIMGKIKYFSILHHLGLSDHDCLLECINTKGLIVPVTTDEPVIKDKPFRYATSDEFLCKLKSPLGQEKLKSFVAIHSEANESSLEKMSTDLVDTLLPLSEAFSSRISHTKKGKRKKRDVIKPWYSSECRKLKCALNRVAKDLKKHPFSKNL